jgi:predicted DNA binding CopG/RHH family protein
VSKVARDTPSICASGHSDAMNWANPASVARAEGGAETTNVTAKMSEAQYRILGFLLDFILQTTIRRTDHFALRAEISTTMSGKSMKKLKPIPAFKTEAEERKFWETHDSTDYVDWSKAERVRLPNLKPSTTAISIRLPLGLLEQIKIAANKRDVPYQSLIKIWLAEKVG